MIMNNPMRGYNSLESLKWREAFVSEHTTHLYNAYRQYSYRLGTELTPGGILAI